MKIFSIFVLSLCALLVFTACGNLTKAPEKPPEKVTTGQIVGAIMSWDSKVISQATGDQITEILICTVFFGGMVVGGVWFGFCTGVSQMIRAYRMPETAEEPEDDE